LARNANGVVRVEGHGFYSRQVRGLTAGWIVIWVRRFYCRACGHTMSRLPDWLHPWRWYAAVAIIEALYRHLILGETARRIGARFGRGDSAEWQSLGRWRSQLLVSPTLWGWLGTRLGIGQPAGDREQGRRYLIRLLGEMRVVAGEAAIGAIAALPRAVHRSLSGVVHGRRQAWAGGQFRPGMAGAPDSGAPSPVSPTEKDSGRGPPG
jgi:hypothetical protein